MNGMGDKIGTFPSKNPIIDIMCVYLRKFVGKTSMLSHTLFLSIFVTLSSLMGCANEQANISDKPVKNNIISQIQFPRNSKFILIPVRFNGKKYQFVLDTGSTYTTFDISLKEQLGWWPILFPPKARTADGKTIKIEFRRCRRAYFGGLYKKDFTVDVMDLTYLSKIAGRRIDGIIGMKLLKDHVMQIDFRNNIVSFLRSSNKNTHSGWEADLSFKRGLTFIKGEIEDISVNFLIDTGFTDSYFGGLLESSVIEKLNSKTILAAQGDKASSLAGPMNFNQRKSIIAKLCFNQVEYENAFFAEHNQSILGLGFLSRHVVTFDFPKKKVYFEEIANTNNSKELSLTLSGFDFTVTNDNNNILIYSIDIDGLGYKKGFRSNDIILKINNLDVTSFGLIEFANFLISMSEQSNIEHFTVTIKRGDEIKEIAFP